jgi:hypothetical protein
VDEDALARLAARDSQAVSRSRHIGILQLADGRRWYTSVNPHVQRLTGCEEGTLRGVRLDLWRDDDSAAFEGVYEALQTQDAIEVDPAS